MMTTNQQQGEATMSDARGELDETKPCVMCGKELESAIGGWETLQPYGGGEINLMFAYGSCKFDLSMHTTVFRGIICDDCAEKIVPKMEALK